VIPTRIIGFVATQRVRTFSGSYHAQEWDRLSVPEDRAMSFDAIPVSAAGPDRGRSSSDSFVELPYSFGTRLSRREWQVLLDRWQGLQPFADRFATAFFDTLFNWDPDLRQLFGGASLEAQFLRFAHLLTEIVSAAGEPDELDIRVEVIMQHSADDSAAEQSRAVRAAIAATLEEVAAAGMTAPMWASWKAAHVAVAALLSGTRSAGGRRRFGTVLHAAIMAALAADRRSPAIDQILEPNADSQAA
jgi:hemoglobin-like flavoprotein